MRSSARVSAIAPGHRACRRGVREVVDVADVPGASPATADRRQPPRCLDRQPDLDCEGSPLCGDEREVGPVKRRTPAGPLTDLRRRHERATVALLYSELPLAQDLPTRKPPVQLGGGSCDVPGVLETAWAHLVDAEPVKAAPAQRFGGRDIQPRLPVEESPVLEQAA
jgi:hypothetical protein